MYNILLKEIEKIFPLNKIHIFLLKILSILSISYQEQCLKLLWIFKKNYKTFNNCYVSFYLI